MKSNSKLELELTPHHILIMSSQIYEDPSFDAFLSKAIDDGIIDQIEKTSALEQGLKEEKKLMTKLAGHVKTTESLVARLEESVHELQEASILSKAIDDGIIHRMAKMEERKLMTQLARQVKAAESSVARLEASVHELQEALRLMKARIVDLEEQKEKEDEKVDEDNKVSHTSTINNALLLTLTLRARIIVIFGK